MRLKHLEMKLQRLKGFPAPRPVLEQYATPADVAARLLYHASTEGAIGGRRVLDLGCGTGVLACGAALLGAGEVVGIDLDLGALQAARSNADDLEVDLDLVRGQVGTTFPIRPDTFETVVMNPPFGAQKKHADRPFIDCALMAAPVVYGIFNAGSLDFVEKYVEGRGEVTGAVEGSFAIPRTFAFHRKDRMEIPVEILRIERTEGC
ncbi:methyltransferase domain-containing protein [Methanofollis formosanus]|uniref:Methyltransferase domain-containing protein n=1 Tax=Methanofollis formosanus TaxID=299308 RepID=A0A8G1A1H1_9EURY|nr:METTL5 family protein [Methanofollis formosanus]QYZ79669.1 methyltransferase domain-containing protein [Methanofollis formosanus]